jgi:hypothetical protein
MGQLTNLYVSQSYQGLIKLANSTTGVTGTLQYTQDGLGNNLPLQISTSSVNITGSFTVNGLPINAVDSSSLVTSASFNAFTASIDARVDALEIETGSLQNQINQKLDTGSFNSYTASMDARTGSYATTGSNVFQGNQTISGSLIVTGSITALSASITYLQTVYQTSSIIFSSGSNILGDEAGDTQTLNGVVNIPLGNLNVTGATTSSLGFFGNLQGTASFASNANSASFAQTAISSSQSQNAVSASQATNSNTASYVLQAVSASYANNATSASFSQNTISGSFSNFAVSSSYAQTASFASNGGVTQILAGPNIIVSPLSGQGQVTISSTGTGTGSFNTATGSYGSFYDTTNQLNPVANTPNSMSFNETAITNGVSISGSLSPFNTYIKTQNAGVYNIQFSAQLDKTDSGTDSVDIWIRKNGIDLLDTATTVTLTGNNDKSVASWNWFVQSATNDYYQLIWASADTDMRLLAEVSSSVHPGVPSVILTANRVDQFLSNTGSFNGDFNGSFTGSLQGTASFASNALSASYAPDNSNRNGLITTGSIGGTQQITGSLGISGTTYLYGTTYLDGVNYFNKGNYFITEPAPANPSFIGMVSGSIIRFYGPANDDNSWISTAVNGAGDYVIVNSNANTHIADFNTSSINFFAPVTSSVGFNGNLQGTASFASNFNRTGLITTGSISSIQAITGSVILSGSAGVELDVKGDQTNTGSVNILGILNLTGDQTISGSLITNTLNDGLIKINTTTQNSSSLSVPFGYISASAAISQSNLVFGTSTGTAGNGQLGNTQTGSIVISGSNNILLSGGNRTSTLAQGTYGYIGGSTNIVSTLPTITTSSILRPSVSNNNLNSLVSFAFTTSSLAAPTFANNNVIGGVNINHQSGSINYSQNINVGTVTSNANNIALPFLPSMQQNYFGAAALTLNHTSSSITATSNIIGGASFTVTNLVSSSVSTTNNGLSFNNNLIIGQANGVWVSGSNTTNRRSVISNIIGGHTTAVSSSQVGADTHLVSSIVFGQNLIVSASHANGVGGSTFVGRYNDASTLNDSQQIVFAVGTGTAVGTRRTGLYVTSGSLVGVSGSLQVIGNTTMTGSLSVSAGITGSLEGTASYATQALTASFALNTAAASINTGSFATTGSNIFVGNQTLTGSFNQTGSMNVIGNPSNPGATIARFGDPTYGVVDITGNGQLTATNQIGLTSIVNWNTGGATNITINNERNAIYLLPKTATGSVIIGKNQSSIIEITGSLLSPSITGSLEGTASYATMALTASFALNGGGGGGSTFPFTGSAIISGSLEVIGGTTITGSLILSGSADPELRVIGNTILTGSVQGNVNALSITSQTASLNLNDGNFFTLQLVSGSATHINPSNIKPGQTVNIRLNTTGSGTVNFPSSVKQISGSSYVPTTTTSVDIITLVSFDSSSLFLANVKNLV